MAKTSFLLINERMGAYLGTSLLGVWNLISIYIGKRGREEILGCIKFHKFLCVGVSVGSMKSLFDRAFFQMILFGF